MLDLYRTCKTGAGGTGDLGLDMLPMHRLQGSQIQILYNLAILLIQLCPIIVLAWHTITLYMPSAAV